MGIMKNKTSSIIYVILAGILWGCMGLFVRNLNRLGVATMGIVSVRAFITSAILFIYLIIFKRKLLVIKIKDIWCFLGTGILSVLFFNFCYFRTMSVTSLSIAAILLYTSPAFIMVMSYFLFKERLSIKKVISLVMTIVGCALVSGLIGEITGSGSMSALDLLIGLGAGFGYALYSIFSRYALERGYHSLTITFYTFLFASIAGVFFTDIPGLFKVFTGSVNGCLFCVGIALLGTLVPYLLYTAGLKGMDNGTASVVVAIEPVIATMISVFVYREMLDIFAIIGIVMVLGAIVLVNISDGRKG